MLKNYNTILLFTALFFVSSIVSALPPPPPDPIDAPISGGIFALAIFGIGYAIKKIRE